MKTLAEIDSNFKVETKITRPDIAFHNVLDKPFEVNGVFYADGKFRRIPEEVAKSVSEGVYNIHPYTTGGRVRFITDSPFIAVNSVMSWVYGAPHQPYTSIAGFDLYIREKGEQTYYNTFVPPFDPNKGFESLLTFPDSSLREIVINMPVSVHLHSLYIGLKDTAVLKAPTPYKHTTPIVYYGSSITQGGCASRPGNTYQNIISRRFDTDFVNLGFSGNAKGEDEMADYIKTLEMSVFVYDYDWNAPTPEHLANTHERMFLKVREANPDIPVVMMSRPKFAFLTPDEEQRLAIIKKTYQNAVERGDKNVYFLSGKELMKEVGNDGTVDNCHPNDSGFRSMANVLGDLLEEVCFK